MVFTIDSMAILPPYLCLPLDSALHGFYKFASLVYVVYAEMDLVNNKNRLETVCSKLRFVFFCFK